ncbi:hydroxymethylbilane synthase [uncultured Thalassospira sp.]|jgi:hydroxymethylbilane synthase|uniref:hydroxymethylbilane synthase n=1 Tax=uncultured Thalassospira sp. TaxID=404382 RepID=UPI0030DD9506
MTHTATDTAKLRIGTRGSPLALAQAYEVRNLLAKAHADLSGENDIEIVVISTVADRVTDRALSEIGGKGLFTKEIDEAQLKGEIDIAVHCIKDVPTLLPDGISMPVIMPREDVRDAFISVKYKSFADMPAGSVVGTASLRRQAMVLNKYPHLKVETFRGNVQTRLRKLEDGQADATLLAMAGLNRLGHPEIATHVIAEDDMLPAVGQGAIGLAIRTGDEKVANWLAPLHCHQTDLRITAERAALRALDGSCKTPIAALAELDANGTMRLRVAIIRPDGSEWLNTERVLENPDLAGADKIGTDAGKELLERGGPDFILA